MYYSAAKHDRLEPYTPAELAEAIARRIPGFEIEYEIDPLRQSIADSWPRRLDDSAAREDWGWAPRYDLDAIVDEMLEELEARRGAVAGS